VCVELSGIARPLLYHTVYLKSRDLDDGGPRGLHRKNPNLGHVRVLKVQNIKWETCRSQHIALLRKVSEILHALPKNTLLLFE